MTTTYSASYYAQLQRSLGATPSFDAILRYHVTCYQATGNVADFQALNSGTAIIQTAEQASAYLAAYGNMHQIKLNSAFGKLSSLSAFPVGRAEVIDWGCGQGLASGVLLDYARHQLPGLIVSRFTLIEPSALALSRADDHLRVLPANGATIRTLLHRADALPGKLVQTDPAQVKIHLFSNLLDMTEVDYTAIAHTIKTTQKGLNLFVCVSPAIAEFRNKRLREFRDQFVKARTLSDRTDGFTGSVFGIYKKAYLPYSIKRTECLFTVQL
ncbi:hypothetical protein [Spirosoma areae]